MKKVLLAALLFGAVLRTATAQTNEPAAISPAEGAPAAISPTEDPASPLLTRRGWEVGGQVSKYHYEEPNLPGNSGVTSVKLTGNRTGPVGAYTFTNEKRLFSRIDLRVSYGSLTYEGSGTMQDVPDTIVETRAIAGKDFLFDNTSLSPYVGLGYRYLFNDLRGYTSTNAVGYRRYSNYLYAPVGMTMRLRLGGDWILAPNLEYDVFIRGRQETKLSDAGVGLPDVSNTQKHGYGYRAYIMAEKNHWAVGPWLHYWNIKDSETQPIGRGFVGLEPANWTREYGLEVRYRF